MGILHRELEKLLMKPYHKINENSQTLDNYPNLNQCLINYLHA
jgi:hypothetical protein